VQDARRTFQNNNQVMSLKANSNLFQIQYMEITLNFRLLPVILGFSGKMIVEILKNDRD